jgi:hypothetical protein
MLGLDFARTTMWFVPSSDPLLRDVIEAATNGVGADGLGNDAFQTSYSPTENDSRSVLCRHTKTPTADPAR